MRWHNIFDSFSFWIFCILVIWPLFLVGLGTVTNTFCECSNFNVLMHIGNAAHTLIFCLVVYLNVCWNLKGLHKLMLNVLDLWGIWLSLTSWNPMRNTHSRGKMFNCSSFPTTRSLRRRLSQWSNLGAWQVAKWFGYNIPFVNLVSFLLVPFRTMLATQALSRVPPIQFSTSITY